MTPPKSLRLQSGSRRGNSLVAAGVFLLTACAVPCALGVVPKAGQQVVSIGADARMLQSGGAQNYLVRIRADVIDVVDSVVIPQLEQYASTIPDSVMQVYLRLRGDAFNGIAVRLTPAIANFVASQGWVESVDLDVMIRATEPLRFAAREDAAELGARKLQSTQGAATSPPAAQPKFTQTNAPFQLDRIDQRSGDTDGKYEYSLTGQGVDVYIMDSGINAQHQEFTGRIAAGANFASDQAPDDTDDCNGHGTHVAGLAAGSTYGVAKQATIIPVRVYGCDNSGPVSNVIAGINYVIGRARASGRRSVVNMSFGGDRIPALDNAVQALVNAGIVVAAAAGNEAQDACNTSPGGSPAAISVGASDKSDKYASFSNFGSCVDIVAPGVNIKSAWIGAPDATETISGTSMATPIVTGVSALVLESNNGASPQDVAGVLTCSATSGVLKNIPTSSTPDKLVFSPPQGFVNGCDTSAAFTDIPQVFKGGLVTALTGIAVAATMVVAWRI